MDEPANDEELTAAEIEQARQLLSRLKPGKLPFDIFLETARLTVTPIVEVVPMRRNRQGTVEVLLTRRDDSDPVWGGMLHTPGTVVRATDQSSGNQDAFDRILQGELSGVKATKPVFVENIFHPVKRGMEQAQVYYIEVLEDPPVGSFYDVTELPPNIVDSQVGFIKTAVHYFEASIVAERN